MTSEQKRAIDRKEMEMEREYDRMVHGECSVNGGRYPGTKSQKAAYDLGKRHGAELERMRLAAMEGSDA